MLLVMRRFVERHPRCCDRSMPFGHVTASAWIVDEQLTSVVLVHHGKLHRWLQPGGHIEDDATASDAARREAQEETGLVELRQVGGLFDVDVHDIPGQGGEPPHIHYDVRYAFVASSSGPLKISPESRELAWFTLEDAARAGGNASIARLVARTPALKPT